MLKNIQTLFANSRYKSTNAAESIRPKFASKATGYFLSYLGHAQISFGLIIIERHVEIIHERQCLISIFAQAVKKISRRRLLLAAALSRLPLLFGERIIAIPSRNQRFVTLTVYAQCLRRKLVPSRIFCSADDFLNVAEQFYHRCRPSLMLLFAEKNQLPQMMRIAQRMQAVKVKIRHIAIMNQSPDKSVEQAIFPQRLLTSPLVTEVICIPTGAHHVLPQKLAANIHACPIAIDDRGSNDGCLDGFFGTLQPYIRLVDNITNRCGTDVNTKQIRHRLCRTLLRQQLIRVEIDKLTANTRAILYRRIYPLGKLCCVLPSAFALPCLRSMLRHLKLWHGYIKHLPTFIGDKFAFRHITTAFTVALQWVFNDMVGILNLAQTASRMTRLPSLGLTAALSQTDGSSARHITAGRLAAVVAVLGHALFEFVDSSLQMLYGFLQRKKCINDYIDTISRINLVQLLAGQFLYQSLSLVVLTPPSVHYGDEINLFKPYKVSFIGT
jgi:hypothetical protein